MTSTSPADQTTTPRTLRSLAKLPQTPELLADSTLLIIDAQHEYLATGALALPDIDTASGVLSDLLAAGRNLDIPIVHIAHAGQPGGLFAPDNGGRIIDAAAPWTNEVVVSKTLPNSFAGTDLASLVQDLGDRQLVIAGFMTHMCVSATARAALDLGITSVVVSDATATRSLPSATGGEPIGADAVHAAALAALADRFAIVATSAELLG